MRTTIMLFTLIITFNPLLSVTNFILEWEKVEGARAYQLQVRDSNKNLLIDERVEKTQFELNTLEVGTYEHRVGVYNKFGKISAFTEWSPFTVIQTFPPEVSEPKELEFEESLETKTILLKGKNFSKKTRVYLFPSSQTNPKPLDRKILNDSEIQIALNMKDHPVGKYNLLLENSTTKKTELKEFLKVKPKPTEVAEVREEPPTRKETKEEIPKKEEPSEPYPYWKEAWQSTYLPGLGQWNKDHKIKAVGFGVLLVGSIAYYLGTVSDFRSAQRNYDRVVLQSAIFASLFPPQPLLTFTVIATNENAFQVAYYKAGLTKQAILGVGAIYGLNILDALLWKKSKPEEPEEFSWFPKFFIYTLGSAQGSFGSGTEYQFRWDFKF